MLSDFETGACVHSKPATSATYLPSAHAIKAKVDEREEGVPAMKFSEFVLEAAASSIAFLASAGTADANVHPLSISGNGWIAVLLLLGFVAVIYLVIIGALKAEERDARLGRKDETTKGWFGMHTDDSDDDDGHHHFHGHG
jgi:hypothetical protein